MIDEIQISDFPIGPQVLKLHRVRALNHERRISHFWKGRILKAANNMSLQQNIMPILPSLTLPKGAPYPNIRWAPIPSQFFVK